MIPTRGEENIKLPNILEGNAVFSTGTFLFDLPATHADSLGHKSCCVGSWRLKRLESYLIKRRPTVQLTFDRSTYKN